MGPCGGNFAMNAGGMVEILLAGAVLGLLVLAFRHESRVGLAAAVVVALALSVAWLVRDPYVPEAAVAERPAKVEVDGYVSSDACRSCHPQEYDSWHASYHRTMTQVATPETALAPFDGLPRIMRGRYYRPFVRHGELWIEMDDPFTDSPVVADGAERSDAGVPRIERRVVLSTGSHHEQDYWFEADPERALAHLPIAYRIVEQRWVPNGSTFLQPPREHYGAPRPEIGGWNRNCIQCHATHGKPQLDYPDSVDTTVGEFGIACESCHGPGAKHVEANRDPARRYRLHRDDDAGDDTIVNPVRLDSRRSSEVCGQCHMASTVLGPWSHPEWNENGHDYRPGDRLADTRDILNPASAPDDPALQKLVGSSRNFLRYRFWSDGMVRISGRELHGLLETPCYQRGEMSCLTCHQMHARHDDPRSLATWANDQLKPEAVADAACLECHTDIAADPTSHTHHEAGSSGSVCMNCHMPHTTYGLLKSIRSHQITNPDVAVTVATTRPNACNLCHLDRPLGWTAERLGEWFGTPVPDLPEREGEVASSILWALTGDAGHRALIAWHMGWEPAVRASGGSTWMELYLAHLLADPYDAVRFMAARSLRLTEAGADLDYDYLEPEADRVATRAALVEELMTRPLVDVADSTALLLDAAGLVREDQILALSRQRDDRRLELRE